MGLWASFEPLSARESHLPTGEIVAANRLGRSTATIGLPPG
jgi:hypothetical protein